MVPYSPSALRVGQVALLAAGLAYVASYVKPPGPDVAAVLAIMAVLLFAAAASLDEPGRLAGVWIAPTVAAAIVLASTTVTDQRLVSVVITALAIFGSLGYPAAASVLNLRERARECFR